MSLRPLERIARALSFVSLLFLSFLAGVVASAYETYAYRKVLEVLAYAEALWHREEARREAIDSLRPTRSYTVSGVVRSDPQAACDGYTFYAGPGAEARLVDMAGKVVHSWRLPFRKAWPQPGHMRADAQADAAFWRQAHLYPNGDVLALYEILGTTPYGAGLVKLDRESNLLWKNSANFHHDVEVGPDGRIYGLTQEVDVSEQPVPGFPRIRPPLIHDYLSILTPDGTLEKKISLLRALVGTPYEGLLAEAFGQAKTRPPGRFGDGDVLHANDVDYIAESMSGSFQFGRGGDLLVSLRNLDAVAVLDPRLRRIVWAITGTWKMHHDPDVLPNGNLLIFDNQGLGAEQRASRVLEVDPVNGRVVWQFVGIGEDRLYSVYGSGQQRLPNGNVLILESMGGRILEVTRQGRVVWEYHHAGGVVHAARRMSPDSLAFLTDGERNGGKMRPCPMPVAR